MLGYIYIISQYVMLFYFSFLSVVGMLNNLRFIALSGSNISKHDCTASKFSELY